MAGILSAIKLREAGLGDVVLYEKASRLGGTWRENTYPGIACDVPSHLYCYSFAPNPDWSHRFSPGMEIQAYLERVAREHGVDGLIRFGEEVTRCELAGGRWRLETARGERDEADVVIAATGVLHHPRYPDIEGLERFRGACFHSARWDHAVPLDGQRVGIVGTGSSAVQITSAIVDRVARLVLFQRTAQWIFPQENPPYSEAEKAEFRRHPELLREVREQISRLFADNFSNAVVNADAPQMQAIEEACRANLEESVRDPVLREKLRPSYRAACKRLVISPDFYQAIQKPNAELVTEGIACVEPAGVRTRDGRLHPLDVLVLATGFRVDRFVRPMEVIGPNGPVGYFSLIVGAELELAYILALVDLLRAGRCRELCPTPAATARFEAERVAAARHTVWMTGCRSWYLDERGIPAVWPWTFDRFREAMAAPRLEDYELVRG